MNDLNSDSNYNDVCQKSPVSGSGGHIETELLNDDDGDCISDSGSTSSNT